MSLPFGRRGGDIGQMHELSDANREWVDVMLRQQKYR